MRIVFSKPIVMLIFCFGACGKLKTQQYLSPPPAAFTPDADQDSENKGPIAPETIVFTTQSSASGVIYYHLNLPYGSGNVETLTLSANYTDLMLSNFVAGAVLGRLIREKLPSIRMNRDYVYGSLFGQLLQENINTASYLSSSRWINPDPDIRAMLLAPGQGGPYQINDYSKRLETEKGLGLVNFVTLQKSLGYSVEVQDNGTQTASNGPELLGDKYFAPMAAAYFHFNDINRMAGNNAESWGPQFAYYKSCIANLSEDRAQQHPFNIFDMILNAAYNAGTYSAILQDTFRICAGMFSSQPESVQIASLGDYSLTDEQYQVATGTKESAQSTFIIYPRQIRLYLDQIYNQKTFNSAAITDTNEVRFSLNDVEAVLQNSLATLAHITAGGSYDFIAGSDTKSAFSAALAKNGLTIGASLNISAATERMAFFTLLDDTIDVLAKNVAITFSETTEDNH